MDTYIYQAELLCEQCGNAEYKRLQGNLNADWKYWDSDTFPQGPGGGEADSPQHCGQCGVFLENPLTSDGEKWLVTALQGSDTTPGSIVTQWAEYYDYDYLADRR